MSKDRVITEIICGQTELVYILDGRRFMSWDAALVYLQNVIGLNSVEAPQYLIEIQKYR